MKHYVSSAIGKDWSKNRKKLDDAASKVDFEKTKSDRWNQSAESTITRETKEACSDAQRGQRGNKEGALGQHKKNRIDSRRSFGRETLIQL